MGRIRATLARDFPGIGWVGLWNINENVGNKLKEVIKADYFTTNFRQLISRLGVDAVMVATST